MPGSVTHGR